jgi:hypothetical protein
MNREQSPARPSKQVPPYEVSRIGVAPAENQPDHDHVKYVETQDPDGGLTRWSMDQISAAIRSGERFATIVKTGRGRESYVTIDPCPTCRLMTLQVDRKLVTISRTV